MSRFIIAQIVGFIMVIVNGITAIQQKTKNIFLYNTIVNLLCVIQYSLLGAYTGIICCLIAMFRNYIFTRYKKQTPIQIFLIYSLIVIFINIYFVHKLIDIIPIVNTIIFAYALSKGQVKKIKISMIMTGSLGIIYDIYEMAYVGLLLNLTDFIGGIVGTWKNMNEKKKN